MGPQANSISKYYFLHCLGVRPLSISDCGKGRPLIVAAAMGFKTVIGVEFVRELVEVARENLRKTRSNATVVCADAAC
jgi:predicted RNA methylase